MERELRVDISRKLVPTRIVKGVQVFEDSGLNYVDAYFPDGTQRTVGYIGRDLGQYCAYAPCCRLPQALMDAIQEKINEQTGFDLPAQRVLKNPDEIDDE